MINNNNNFKIKVMSRTYFETELRLPTTHILSSKYTLYK